MLFSPSSFEVSSKRKCINFSTPRDGFTFLLYGGVKKAACIHQHHDHLSYTTHERERGREVIIISFVDVRVSGDRLQLTFFLPKNSSSAVELFRDSEQLCPENCKTDGIHSSVRRSSSSSARSSVDSSLRSVPRRKSSFFPIMERVHLRAESIFTRRRLQRIRSESCLALHFTPRSFGPRKIK